MRRLRGLAYLLLLLPLLLPVQGFAQTVPSQVLITEVQTTGLNNVTDQEFVEIYNVSNNIIKITDWKLQYLSGSGTSWQTKTVFNGYLMPKGRMLIASSNYLVDSADTTFSSGLKLDAGHVRIVSPDPGNETVVIVEDLIGWGAAISPDTTAAVYAPAGQSIVRKIDEQGTYIDTNNNLLDFEITPQPTPESDNPVPDNIVEIVGEDPESVESEEEPQSQATIQSMSTKLVDQSGLAPALITELLPNPAPPETDSEDEYIELYNPNSTTFHLRDYKLETGNSFSRSYTFGDEVIEAYSYLVLYSRETGLTLANASSKARLVDPSGTVVSETDPYENAKDGRAWSWVDGTWQWNAQPTAGETNVLVMPTTKSATKKKAAKKAKTKKSSENGTVARVAASNNGGQTPAGPINKWIIAGVGVIALGYGIYEYKDDVRNKLIQFRRNRAFRRNPRTSP